MNLSVLSSLIFIILFESSTLYSFESIGEHHYRLSCHYVRTKKIDLAEEHMRFALKNDCGQAFLEEGCNAAKNGNIKKAEKLIKTAYELGNPYATIALVILNNQMDLATRLAEEHNDKILYPEYHNPMSLMGGICFMMGKYNDAEKYLKKAIELGTGNDTYSKLAHFYKEQQQYDLAIEYYKKASEKNEECYDFIELGKIYYELGYLDLAQHFWEKKQFEHDFDASLYLALIHYHKNNIPLAKKYLTKIYNVEPPSTSDPLQAKIDIEKQMNLNYETSLLKDLAIAYYKGQQFENALHYFMRCLELSHQNEILIWIGKTYRKINKLILAENTYLKVLETWPCEGYYGLAKIALQKKDNHRAEELFQQSLNHQPSDSFYMHEKILKKIIDIYDDRNDNELKELYLKRLLNKACSYHCFELGESYHNKNNIYWAKKFYKKAIEGAGCMQAANNLGLIYYQQNKYNKAEKCFLLSSHQGSLEAFCNLGVLYFEQNKYDLAENYLNIAANQHHVQAMNNLSLLYLKQNKIPLARAILERSIMDGNYDSTSEFLLGYLYEKQGMLEYAKIYYLHSSKTGNLCARGRLYQFEGKLDLAEQKYNEALENNQYHAYYYLSTLYNQQGKHKLANEYLEKADQYNVIY